MKRKHIYKIFALLVSVTIIFVSCTKETAEVRLEPTLSTSNTFDLTSESATVVGFVIADGDGFTEKGVCYATSASPTINDNKVAYTGDTPTATYNVVIHGLDYATTYFARSYAISKTATVYGEEVTFTTLPVVPFLTTIELTDITGNSAIGGGNVTGSGGADVTARAKRVLIVNSAGTAIKATQQEENRAGTDCSGIDGALGRVLTLQNTSTSGAPIAVWVEDQIIAQADITVSHLATSSTVTLDNINI